MIYNKLVLSKSEQPLRSQGKWCREICPEPEEDHEINWKSVYLLAFECTKSSKLRVFNFKFLHHRLSTNDFLYKIGLSDNEKCTFCERETETLFHLFWNCESTQLLWNNLVLWLQTFQVLTKNMPLRADTALGMRPDTSKLGLPINSAFLVAKYHIWTCKQKECSPNFSSFFTTFEKYP